MLPLWLCDFYKIGHVSQYDQRVRKVISNWTPRSTRTGTDAVVFFGLQYFLKIIQKEWNDNFFQRPLEEVLTEYRAVLKGTLGLDNPKTDHIEFLHKLGYLPIEIYALPEGSVVNLRVPMLVITNTVPEAFWLPNYMETILSLLLWKSCTSATTAREYRKLFERHALLAGETDLSFIDWQGHDFSMRGMSGREDAILSGMGHLLSFKGTDTIPAIIAAHDYYGADYSIGGSVPATEHSVMCAGGKENEQETFRRLIEDVYPSGVVSIVSDTWDLWKVINEIVPALKDKILARDGKVVLRPDSGDPVKIMTGDDEASVYTPEGVGALRLLSEAMGVTYTPGGKMINKAGLIYGDSISLERADAILTRCRKQGFSPYNIVFGIGSYTYEYVTRDTYGFAMKATAVEIDGKIVDIFKDPVTDDGVKKSLKGIPIVKRSVDGFVVTDGGTMDDLNRCAMNKEFKDGVLLFEDRFEDIRTRLKYSLF